jgi:hypothetical protein
MIAPTISILIITYRRDMVLIDKLLASLEKFMTPGYTIHIVLNENISHRPRLQVIVAKYPALTCKIYHNLELTDEFASNFPRWGHADQQICKLMFAQISPTDYYFILDCKNYVTDAFDPLSHIIDGRTVSVLGDYNPDTDMWTRGSYKIFGLDPDDYRDKITWSITPFVMKTSIVKDMLNWFRENNYALTDIIGVKPGNKYHCSEFLLYNAWLHKNNIFDQEILLNHGWSSILSSRDRSADPDPDVLEGRGNFYSY